MRELIRAFPVHSICRYVTQEARSEPEIAVHRICESIRAACIEEVRLGGSSEVQQPWGSPPFPLLKIHWRGVASSTPTPPLDCDPKLGLLPAVLRM